MNHELSTLSIATKMSQGRGIAQKKSKKVFAMTQNVQSHVVKYCQKATNMI